MLFASLSISSKSLPRATLLKSPQIAALAGAQTGFDRACPECPVKSRTVPIMGFDRARTVQIPYGARPGFERASRVYHGLKLGMPIWGPRGISLGPTEQGTFHLAMGKPWACPYGARAGLKRGCPCPHRPWCAHGCPYQAHMGLGRGRYLGVDRREKDIDEFDLNRPLVDEFEHKISICVFL